MNYLMLCFAGFPLLGFLICLLIPEGREKLISGLSLTVFSSISVGLVVFLVAWIWQGSPELNVKELVVYKTEHYEFFIDFYFDKTSAVFLLVGSWLTTLISIYSRVYLHREKGFKRFYNTILLFFTGFAIVVLAGNFETMFLGWEFLGISSFLLIAFYRERVLPVRNAYRVYSVYRLSDVGLVLAMWMSHHLWHESITFYKLHNYQLVHHALENHSWQGFFISIAIVLAASAKSAQLPFTAWLPRAMEGPTPSSAIFYGSLSVHMGVFVLLRTHPFWEHQISARILVGLIGLSTSVVASGIAKVQTTVKSQIAYSSAAQIGLIFIELSLGFENLALFHFGGNAFLRTYQLLVSPSVVSYLINEQFFNFIPRAHVNKHWIVKKWRYTQYMLNLKEWYLDHFIFKWLWRPTEWLGHRIVSGKIVLVLSLALLPVCMVMLVFVESPLTLQYLPSLLSFIGLILVCKAYVEIEKPSIAWLLVIVNHFYTVLAISFNEHFESADTVLYLSGVLASGIVGFVCLYILSNRKPLAPGRDYHGWAHAMPVLAGLFLLSSLGVAGFPITPTFIGEDLIYSHIHSSQKTLILINAATFVVDGLVLIRLYSHLFMGPDPDRIYANGYKAS